MSERATILVVDDVQESLELLIAALAPAGYRVLPADSAELALRAIEASPPDLVLLDVRLQGMSGLELCRILKAREATRSIPVILVSGYAETPQWVEGLQAGAADYVTKPFRAEELLTRVGTQLALRRATAERELAQRALKASEEKFSKAFQTSSIAITITRPADGKFIDVNDAFTAITGYTREEALADSSIGLALWVDAEDRARVLSALGAGGGVSGRELRFRKKDGAVVTCLFSAGIIRIGDETCILSSIDDITDRKRAEEALRKSEEQYRVLVENAEQAIFVAQGGVLKFANSRTRQLLGYSAPELAARPFTELVHPDDRALVVDRHLRRLRGEEIPTRYAFRVVDRDGRTLWAELHAVAIEWQGAPATLNFVSDITERRREEERRAELEERLRSASKMEAIGRLVGGIAHDFNNLLSVVLSYTGFALQATPPDAPVHDDLLEVKRAGERAAALVRQLLAFGRKQMFELRLVDLNRIVSDLEKMLGRVLGEDVAVVQDLEADLGAVLADASQIEQVIVNLVVNARDAMPNGGTLTLRSRNAATEERASLDGGRLPAGRYVVLTVGDTGCGMDAATLAQAFEPFFTTKERGKGSGLGLSTVYGIVKQSGGDVSVRTEPGLGATFEIWLPRASSAAVTGSLPPLAPTTARGDETVLLVEDEPAVRSIAHRILADAGYAVLVAADGAEALAIGESYAGPIHVVLTDVVMPGMRGTELVERLGRLRTDFRVLYMSGYTESSLAAESAGRASRFIAKPFDRIGLLRRLREVLDET